MPKARLEGSARAVAAAGLDWSRVPVELVPVTSAEGCLAGARALLDRAPGTTALFAFSDPLALAVRQAARERGLAVPGDLSIVGFDDTAPGERGAHQHPPAAPRQGPHRRRAAARRPGSGAAARRGELLPTRLVVRDSTGRPPAG